MIKHGVTLKHGKMNFKQEVEIMKIQMIKFIKKFKIDEFLFIGLLLFFTHQLIFYFYSPTENTVDLLLYYGLTIFCFWFWSYTIFTELRNIVYGMKTNGRSFTKDHSKYLRSWNELVEYFKDSEPHKLDINTFPQISWKDTTGIMFGIADDNHLIKLNSNAEGNIAVFGAPGSRKTSGIAIPSAAQFDGSVLAVDIKGDIYNFNKNHRKILRFCPDAEDALQTSAHFDPFQDVKQMNSTERKLFFENMAIILIADEGGSDGNYFSSRARKFFQGILSYLFYIYPDITFPEVLHAILHPDPTSSIPHDPFEWVMASINSDCNEAKEQLASFYGNNEKNISGAFDCLTTSLVSLSNPTLDILLDGRGDCISMQALDSGYDCYLQISQEHLDAYAPLFTLILQSLMTAFSKRPDKSTGINNRNILFILDEFPQLTFSYKQINSSLSTLRSKNIISLIIAQSRAQIEHKYKDTGARSILGNCTYQLILSCNDGPSQLYFSKLIGTKKVLKVTNSKSQNKNKTTNRTIQEARDPVFQPEDFGDLKDNLVIYYDGKYTTAKKINCYK